MADQPNNVRRTPLQLADCRANILVDSQVYMAGRRLAQGTMHEQNPDPFSPLNSDVLRSLIEKMPTYLAYLDRDFNFLMVNSAYASTSGYKREELIGRNHFDLFPHPENQATFEKVRDTGEPASVVAKPFVNPELRDKGITYWDWTLLPLKDPRGQVEGLALFLIDVTERLRFEAALEEERDFTRAILETTGALVVVLDTEGRIVRFNRACERATGRSLDEVRGSMLWDLLLIPEDIPAVQEVFKSLKAGQFPNQHENFWVAKDGSLRNIAWSNTAILDAQGYVAYVIGTGIDITDKKKAETELQESERELSIRGRIAETFLRVPDDEMYSEVLKVVLEALKSKYGFFGYVDPTGALVCPSMTTDVWHSCQIADKSNVFPRERWSGIWGRAMEEKRTIYSNGGLKVPEGHIALRRAMAVPILFRGEVIGEIAVADKDTDYDEDDRRLLEAICGYIATILHARLQTELESKARRRAEDALARLRRQMGAEPSFAGIVGQNPRMLELFQTIEEVARIDVPVLILGESGTGKELVAIALHNFGHRREGPFVAVNCSALPKTLLESELFGHVRGSFSGAVRDKKGRFELADGGTIFLDEVGDLTPSVQVSLLRVLQEGIIERVGAEKSTKVNVRVVSATNQDIHRLVASGAFREDLYFRLCVVPVHVPPLRDRRDDIPLLAHHILRQITADGARKDLGLSEGALKALQAYDWPGNVRELQNAIHFATVKCKGNVLELAHLPPAMGAAPASTRRSVRKGRKRKLNLEEVHRILEEVEGNRREAARRLRVSRATLYKYLGKLHKP